MQQRLKERLVGAAVLIFIAVVFIPMFLTGPIDAGSITETNIPERTIEKFNSRLIPLNNTVTPDAAIDAEDVEEQPKTDDPIVKPNVETSSKPESISAADGSSKKPESNKIVKNKQVGLTAWVVQLGSFSSKVNADKLNLTLRKSGFPAFVEPLEQNNEVAYRVRVGPELLRADADVLLKKIKENTKLDGIVLNYP
ncbi:MAG: DedD protein [Gammaproteobacteria bacterium]|jgi:DedD protein